MLSAAASAASSPEFAESLKEVGGTTADLVEVYQKGQEIAAKVKQSEKTLHSLRDAVRKPTFENLSRLGGALYDQMDDSSKEQWEGFVREKAKPLLPLVELARDNRALQHAVVDRLREAGLPIPTNALDFNAVEGQVKKHFEGLIQKHEDQLRAALDSRVKEILDEAGREKWEQYWKQKKAAVMDLVDRAGADGEGIKKAVRNWITIAQNGNLIELNWDESAKGHLLESVTNPSPPYAWQFVTTGTNAISLPRSRAQLEFFRLRHP